MEPVGMITSIILFLVILATALLSGSANALLDNFSGICWIILLVFGVIVVIHANKCIKAKANPILAYICSFISELSFAFFVMLTVRDLALVAAEGILGLFGFSFLVPLYGIGLGICRAPNMLSSGVTEDHGLLVIDAFATPCLILLACWIFGFFDSVPSVLAALFG